MSESQPIIEFWADRTVIRPGEQATLGWRVQGVKEVYFFQRGLPWQEHGVVGEGSRQVSPSETAAYRLRVHKVDGSVDVREIVIEVQGQAVVQDFSVDRTSIRRGECVTFRWHVEGVKEVYFYPEPEGWQNHGVVGVSEKQVCPSQTTNYGLRVVKRDNSVDTHFITIQVSG